MASLGFVGRLVVRMISASIIVALVVVHIFSGFNNILLELLNTMLLVFTIMSADMMIERLFSDDNNSGGT